MTSPELYVALRNLKEHHDDIVKTYHFLRSGQAITRDSSLRQDDFGQLPSCPTVAKAWNEACARRAEEADEIRSVFNYITENLFRLRDMYIEDDYQASREFTRNPEA